MQTSQTIETATGQLIELVKKRSEPDAAITFLDPKECEVLGDLFTTLDRNWNWMKRQDYENFLASDWRRYRTTAAHRREYLTKQSLRQYDPGLTDRALRKVGMFYLDLQQTRISTGLRLKRYIENELVNQGVIVIVKKEEEAAATPPQKETPPTTTEEEEEEESEETTAKKHKEILKRIEEKEEKEGGSSEVLQTLKDILKNRRRDKSTITIPDLERAYDVVSQVVYSPMYRLMQKASFGIQMEEEILRQSAEEIFEGTVMWKYCQRVRGLNRVAVITFHTIVNFEKIADPITKLATVGKVWSYLGLQPGQGLKVGQVSKFNPHLKGRMWVISKNVILAGDPYYKGIYDIQKKFYLERPDLVAFYERNKKKGFRARCDKMAARWMRKLLISHAVEMMALEKGYKFSQHHNYLPPKPENSLELYRILDIFKEQRGELLNKYRQAWKFTNESIEGTASAIKLLYEQGKLFDPRAGWGDDQP